MRGATITSSSLNRPPTNFNPRSSCEERHAQPVFKSSSNKIFQSTLLMRGATWKSTIWHSRPLFQSTLLMRGATKAQDLNDAAELISIHAPHARSDPTTVCTVSRSFRFQSTLLMRGATSPKPRRRALSHFNPRSSCEERQSLQHNDGLDDHFNPRSSCEERRRSAASAQSARSNFNPRSSCEERHKINLYTIG